MKYEVVHSVLMGADKKFKQGEMVTPDQLKEAGFDAEFLAKNGAIEPLRGTADDSDFVTAPGAVVGATTGTVSSEEIRHPNAPGRRPAGRS